MSKETIQQLVERHIIDNNGQWNHEKDEAWILAGQGQFKITREEFNSAADRMRGKPDWKDAPDWAQWLAQDADGHWFWHKAQPSIDYISEEFTTNKPHMQARRGSCVGDWRNTLQKRPEQKVETVGEAISIAMTNAANKMASDLRDVVNSAVPAKPWFEAGELPPAGSTELDCKIKGKAYEQIKCFKVLAHENGKAVIASYHNEREHWAEIESYHKRPVNFTPYVISKPYFLPIESIKTDKEKFIETALDNFDEISDQFPPAKNEWLTKLFGQMFDAGFKVPDQK